MTIKIILKPDALLAAQELILYARHTEHYNHAMEEFEEEQKLVRELKVKIDTLTAKYSEQLDSIRDRKASHLIDSNLAGQELMQSLDARGVE